MEDIGAKLYELIKSEFDQLTARDVQLIGLTERIKREKATTKDLSEYSCRLGTHLRTAIEHNVSADALPNGQMYYNIAEKILSPLLHDNYDDINDIAVNIQEQLDKAQGIHIKPQKADFPEDRLRTVLNAAAEPELDEATMIRRMSSPAENMTAGFADDYIEANAKFRSKAGFDTYIIRDDHSGCCPWCAKQAGKYRYPDEVPKEVFGRHDNCKCTVEYITGGTRQNVWTKKTSELTAEQKEKIELQAEKRPTVFSSDESKQLEAEQLAKRAERLTGGTVPQTAEPLYKFVEAKTIEEAQVYAQQFCESSFMAKNFKGVVDFKGISVENANKINRALTDVYNRVELDKLSGIKTVAPGSALGKKAFKDGADAVFSYDPIQHGIYVNKDILKNEKTFAEYVKRSEDSWNTVMNNIDKLSGSQKELALVYQKAGRSLVDGATVEGMFTHELGHHAQWTLLDAKTNNSVGSRMSEFAPKISGYANASKSEYLAESFTAYMKGEKDILDQEYVKFIDSKTIDKNAESGIIESRSIASRNLPNGLRTTPSHILTEAEIKSLKKDIASIGADESVFKFNKGYRTGYDDVLDEIRVKGDILPDLSSTHPRDRMSSRAALAHEYYGHRAYRGTNVPKGAWNDEFRASYMAAKNCPNLRDEERADLILDALERAKESGVTIKYNDFIRRILYGY